MPFMVIGIIVIGLPRPNHLPRQGGIAVHRGENRAPLLVVVRDRARRLPVESGTAVAEYVAGLRIALYARTVDRGALGISMILSVFLSVDSDRARRIRLVI